MASGKYRSGRVAVLKGNIDFINSSICCALMDSRYIPDLEDDASYADLPEDSIMSESVLTGKTIDETDVIFSADSVIFPNVAESDFDVTSIVLFLDKEEKSQCTLIAYFDDLDGFPIEPDGDDIIINWDDEGILIG